MNRSLLVGAVALLLASTAPLAMAAPAHATHKAHPVKVAHHHKHHAKAHHHAKVKAKAHHHAKAKAH